jgi:hypothetical protein
MILKIKIETGTGILVAVTIKNRVPNLEAWEKRGINYKSYRCLFPWNSVSDPH